MNGRRFVRKSVIEKIPQHAILLLLCLQWEYNVSTIHQNDIPCEI